MLGILTLGRPMGIRLGIHWSFWLLPLFVLFSTFGESGLAMAGLNVAMILAVFACIALHELGHAAAAKMYGIRTRDIVLYPLGGVASLERMPRNPYHEIVIALAGPAGNVLIIMLILPFLMLLGPGATVGESLAGMFLYQLMWANGLLVAFNLLPAFPMDGGRVFRATMSIFTTRAKATSIAATVGIVFAVMFGILGVLTHQYMLLIIAFFLFVVGQNEERQVHLEEEERERREFRGTKLGWPFGHGVPIVTNATPTDGWTFDPSNQMWTKWEHGVAVARHRKQ